MEEALRASEERFRRVIESNIIGVIVVENGILTEANDVFLQMVKFNRGDLVRKQLRWREMTPADVQDVLDRYVGAQGYWSFYTRASWLDSVPMVGMQ